MALCMEVLVKYREVRLHAALGLQSHRYLIDMLLSVVLVERAAYWSFLGRQYIRIVFTALTILVVHLILRHLIKQI